MAIGFTPKHIEEVPLNELSPKQFLVIAIETVRILKWDIGYLSNNGLIAYTNNGSFSWNAEIIIKIDKDFANLKSSSTGNDMIDWGKNEKNINTFIATFEQVKASFSIAEIDSQYEVLKNELIADEEDILLLPPATTSEQIKDFFSIFVPSKESFVTPILMDINIAIFILMVISGVGIMLPDTGSLIEWGANFKVLTLNGQWWRLFTNCFLHIGIIHLFMNMYALLYIGALLEPILGKIRFITAYLLAGILASLNSLWWHDLGVSAGASGAIFGMYGVFLALLSTDLIEKEARKTLLTSISIFVGFNLLNGLKGGIDNAAHIGGLLSGVVIGYAFIPSLKQYENKKLKFVTVSAITVVVFVTLFTVYHFIPKDLAAYETQMNKFASMEAMALDIYEMPEETPKEERLEEIKNRGIYYWSENQKILQTIDKLKLPDELHERNIVLKKYCKLRLEVYNLMYKKIAEDTDKYNQAIEDYDKKIDNVLVELKEK